jgi:hypothetical protein
MKKTIVLFLLATAILTGCKTTSATNTKVDNKSAVAMKGNWIINSVTYPGSEYIKINSFGLADSKCFEGSTWKFISNNNKGQMTLAGGAATCGSFSSPITWFVNKQGQFVLKILNAGEKAKKVRDGYVLTVMNQTASSFQLVDKSSMGEKTIDIVYQFQKVN